MEKNEKEWADFGRSIWDAGMKAYKGTKVVVPFMIDDGGMCTVEITAPTYFDRRTNPKTLESEFRHGVKLSDGTIEWGDWR